MSAPRTASSTAAYTAAAQRFAGLLGHLGVGTHAFDDALGLVSPLLRVNRLHARIVQRIAESPSSHTLVLQAGAAFPGVQAGQHMLLTVEINGVRHRRAYSPRAIEGRRDRIAITVQRQPHGLVSNWLNDRARVGDVVEVGAPDGEFLLPDPLPPEVLLVAGGSGITPGYAMLEQLRRIGATTRVTLIYFARSRSERIFGAALERLAADWRGLRYVPVETLANVSGPGTAGRVLDESLLNDVLPHWTRVPAYCCGPAPLMETARRLWAAAGAGDLLSTESFGAARAPQAADEAADTGARHQISLAAEVTPGHAAMATPPAQQFSASPALSLLEAGEAAGLAIKHGCRQGVCHECACRLEAGSVRDMLTGERIEAEGQSIRLCVSAALSDVSLQATP